MYDFAPVLALSPTWEENPLWLVAPRMRSINIVCRLNHRGKLDEASQDKKQKVATGLICDKLNT